MCFVLASLVGVGATDFTQGNKKMILAFTWQLMRYHTLKILSSLAFDGFEADENDILSWANDRVERKAGHPELAISSFRDSSLATSVFLLHLLHSLRPIVNWSLVTTGATASDKEKNARYVISVARAMGAIVFCSWEDLVEIQPKMIMMLVASVMKTTTASERVVGGGMGGMGGIAEEDEEDEDDDVSCCAGCWLLVVIVVVVCSCMCCVLVTVLLRWWGFQQAGT